ncbi:MAG TPA: hypothetical protein VMJ32_10970 [Pirellulales bacterium]|nr:hypothetical protein [Pirellulales bacterium]
MFILSQFVLRLSLGLAFAMAITSPKKVTSGFFRNHAYVLLGLNVIATLAAVSSHGELVWWMPLAAAVFSYACATSWLYERPKTGLRILWMIFALSLANAITSQTVPMGTGDATALVIDNSPPFGMLCLWTSNVFTAGILLGGTLAAMFLGHWYLNSPTMEISPLNRLLKLMATATVARGAVCLMAFLLMHLQGGELSTVQSWLLVLRWTAGIFGTAMLTWMAWQTLKIPNTQSATGILYVAVLATFLGELTSLLLSSSSGYPL